MKKRAGIENLRIHDLRRTVGSWLAQAGVSLHLIGDVLNHLDTSTTAGYAYFQTQDRRKALSDHADKVLQLGAPHLLEKLRTIGGGPRFRKLGRRIVYKIVDLDAWAESRACESTSDPAYTALRD